jgi:hypothetical protein
VPAGLAAIGSQAFGGCGSLDSITIPTGVTSIGERAFDGCDSLSSITVQALKPPAIGGKIGMISKDTSPIVIYVPPPPWTITGTLWAGKTTPARYDPSGRAHINYDGSVSGGVSGAKGE